MVSVNERGRQGAAGGRGFRLRMREQRMQHPVCGMSRTHVLVGAALELLVDSGHDLDRRATLLLRHHLLRGRLAKVGVGEVCEREE